VGAKRNINTVLRRKRNIVKVLLQSINAKSIIKGIVTNVVPVIVLHQVITFAKSTLRDGARNAIIVVNLPVLILAVALLVHALLTLAVPRVHVVLQAPALLSP
jgi:hypothetical protein